MNKNDKNIKTAYVMLSVMISAILALGTYAICVVAKDGTRKYIVNNKGDNKICFEDLDSMRTQRVMDFSLDTDSAMRDYYKYINVGDTLSGNALNNNLVIRPFSYHGFAATKEPKITKINGHNARAVIASRADVARRDSIVREMKTKQR